MQIRINYIKLEELLFLIILILNLLPVAFTQFVPTLDGPAHLYNSSLIDHILFGSNELLSKFYKFTPDPVPNWSGHFILSFFKLFLPGYVSEKIFVICYAVLLPLTFRYLVKSINPNNYFFCYLIFPFVYNFPYFLGFYNFCIGLIFLFLTLGFWIRRCDKEFTKKHILWLFILFTTTYFSHVFVFVMLLFITGIHLSITTFPLLLLKENKGLIFNNMKRRIGILLLTALPAIAMTIYYFYNHSALVNYTYISKPELVSWLKNIRPTIVFNIIDEEKYTKKFNYILGILFIIGLYNRICTIQAQNEMRGTKSAFRTLMDPTDSWLISALAFLILYFKLPDADGSAGYVSIRLALLFYLFLIVWICSQKFPRWLALATIPIMLFYNFKLNVYYESEISDMDETAQECYKAMSFIKPNSVVLPLCFADDWMKGHFSNYMGSDKPMIILENYESATGYFPLKWNDEEIPNTYIGESPEERENCVNWRRNVQNEPMPINYIFIMGNIESKTDDCNKRIFDNVKKYYSEIYSSMECKLYERK